MSTFNRWEEKLAIHDLCARYTLLIDAHDIDAWVKTFTEDGMFGFGGSALVGRDSILAYGNVHKTLVTRHLTTSMLYEVDPTGDTAAGGATTVMTIATPEGFRVGFIGRYDDRLRKVDGEWRFASRWVTGDTLSDVQGLGVDAAVAPLVQRLLDAYERLGVPTPAPPGTAL